MGVDHGKGWRLERVVLICAGLALWIGAFYPFISGQKNLTDDAQPYYEHVRFFLDNVSVGIYPLWDPVRDFGVDNEFYLRRIGEFNPAYLSIILLEKCGVDFVIAHRIFLCGYFFLGVWGFYALARRLFLNPLTPILVLLTVLFSSLGTLAFHSYLLLILVPQIWFMYFLLSFFRKPSREAMLGAVFCLMIIAITYIPYYFITVVLCALAAFMLIFYNGYQQNARQCGQFFLKDKKLILGILLLLVVGSIPGLLWNQQSAKGEMAVVYRHSGAETNNAAVLHINTVNEGGIIAPRIADRMFFELSQAKLGDFYLPAFVYLLLLTGIFVGITRRMVFFFGWGFLVYLIGVADASKVHLFLYQHVFFFKYFRNLQFFLWLGVLPAIVFFLGEIFEGLMKVDFKTSKARIIYGGYVLLVHAAAFVFLWRQDISEVIPSTYAVIIVSLLFFLCLPFKNNIRAGRMLPLLLLLGISVQSMDFFGHIRNNTPVGSVSTFYAGSYMRFNLPETESIPALIADQNPQRYLNKPFYSSREFEDMHQNMNRSVLSVYIKPRLLLYDGVEGIDQSTPDWLAMNDALGTFQNSALVERDKAGLIRLNYHKEKDTARIVTQDAQDLRVVLFTADRLKLKSDLRKPGFLVYNNVYHSKWRAYCDGRQITLFRANYAFMGVEVPAGAHEIEFVFQQPWRKWLGLGLEGFYLITAVVLVVLLIRKRI